MAKQSFEESASCAAHFRSSDACRAHPAHALNSHLPYSFRHAHSHRSASGQAGRSGPLGNVRSTFEARSPSLALTHFPCLSRLPLSCRSASCSDNMMSEFLLLSRTSPLPQALLLTRRRPARLCFSDPSSSKAGSTTSAASTRCAASSLKMTTTLSYCSLVSFHPSMRTSRSFS